jgi:NAD(P)-dependent dehydrogenase (short-subunit alcohol dehydrogenase family)
MTDPTLDLSDRTALITGASRGIGHAIAAQLLARGANVAVTARKPDELATAAEELAAGVDGGRERVLAQPGNAGDADARAAAVDSTVERFGSLDILVNNTGINPVFGPLVEADLDAVRKIFDVNVVAALGFVQQAHKAWMGEHGGTIVNLASVGGLRSTGVTGAYGASKAAVIRLSWITGETVRVDSGILATGTLA